MTAPIRVLGIDPSTRNVSFVVLEGPTSLIDWGTKTTRKADSPRALEIIRGLVDRFQPQVVAIEDCHARGSRRCARVRTLLDEIVSTVAHEYEVCRISTGSLRSYGQTKYERALALAGRFPELQPRLPRLRKPWMSEDERINLFDALSCALACLGERQTR